MRIHDARTAKPSHVLRGHRKVVHAVACSPHHDYFVSGSDDGLLLIGRMSDGTWVRTLQRRGSQIWAAHFADRGRVVWTAAQDGVVRAYRVRDGRMIAHIPVTSCALMSMDIRGRQLVVGGSDGVVHLLDTRTRKVQQTLRGHDQTTYAVQFHPRGRWLASGSADWTVRVWDLATGKTHQKLDAFENCVSAVAWSPDGRLAVGCAGGAIHILGEAPAVPSDE